MADGGMLEGDKVLEVGDMSDGFPYMPNLHKGVAYTAKYGACDPLMGDQFQRLTPFRFATAFYRWTRQAGGELLLAAGSSLTLFGQGADEAGGAAAAGGGAAALTRSDTNAFDQGGVAKQGNKFVAIAATVQPLAPFIVASGAVCVGPNATRRRAAWFTGGTDYTVETLRLLFDSINAQLQHGTNTACQYNLGTISQWQNASPVGDGFKPQAGIPGAFTYLAIPDQSGNRNAGDNFNLVLATPSALQVDSDPLNPTVAGFDFVTPVRFSLVGFPVCDTPDNGGACMTPAGNGAALERRMNKLEGVLGELASMMRQGMTPALGAGDKGSGRYSR